MTESDFSSVIFTFFLTIFLSLKVVYESCKLCQNFYLSVPQNKKFIEIRLFGPWPRNAKVASKNNNLKNCRKISFKSNLQFVQGKKMSQLVGEKQ